LKILFSPSEGKVHGGDGAPLSPDALLFPDYYPKRQEVLDRYMHFIKHADTAALQKLIGTKKESECEAVRQVDLYNDPTMKALQRYSGVAYDYLEYALLSDERQAWLDRNLLLFSNLFGPILGGDMIPWYKLKQGEKLEGFAVEKHYAKHFTPPLDTFLEGQFIIDLRAGFYLKFYKLKQPHVTMKFIKNGKVVSHWAKAYRGMAVKTLSEYRPQNEAAFREIPFPNLSILEIKTDGLKTEYIYEITA